MSGDVSEIAVASLRSHRLIVAVANDGTTDVQSNLHPREVAHVLRQLAGRYESAASVATGKDTSAGGESTRDAGCCHLHRTSGCCDPEDCGPCCGDYPTCPTLARRREEK